MKKRCISFLLILTMLAGLIACSSEPETVVYVQNVGDVVGMGSIALHDKFAGVVVSENSTKVSRDYGRTISMLFVTEGQDVKEGDVLFSYDSEALELEVEKKTLELERMQQESSRLQTEIKQLQDAQKKAGKDEQLGYTINIQEKQAALKENEYSINMKKREIAQTQKTLENAQVTAPISGRIVSIDEENSGSDAYITIQQAGTYRVKASMNELNRGAIFEGTAIRVTSRTDAAQSWYGYVSVIDTEGGSSGSGDNYNYGNPVGEYATTTKYPFYVELESVDGLMLGQHVFVEVDNGTEEETEEGLKLPSYYICFEYEEAEEGQEMKAYVWADNGKDRLEKRYLSLGVFDEMNYTYEILDGLTEADYIAFPEPFCAEGVGTTRNPDEVVFDDSVYGQDGFDGEMGDDMVFPDDGFGDDGFYGEDIDEGNFGENNLGEDNFGIQTDAPDAPGVGDSAVTPAPAIPGATIPSGGTGGIPGATVGGNFVGVGHDSSDGDLGASDYSADSSSGDLRG